MRDAGTTRFALGAGHCHGPARINADGVDIGACKNVDNRFKNSLDPPA